MECVFKDSNVIDNIASATITIAVERQPARAAVTTIEPRTPCTHSTGTGFLERLSALVEHLATTTVGLTVLTKRDDRPKT
ncbi:hypothetical protein PLANPX_4062 [Lacipirellula parvula]|uniref:Uncharacterized protein n=1 Tax=Lacipirellula parvula TaxID=2650471 RepID=A0A5K7XCA3_9BACT|nr:hypothetical protein PLANPX_4062 [Lacipirellula parvula]